MAEVYKSSKSINTGMGNKAKQSYSATNKNGNQNNRASMNNNNNKNKQQQMNKQQMKQNNNMKNTPDGDNGEDLNMQQQIKKKAAKETLTQAAKAYNPALGAAVEKALETKKGNEYLDEFAKADTTHQGIKNVERKAKSETRRTTIILTLLATVGPFFIFIFLFLILFAKNTDSQTYSNVNDGEVIILDDDN